ncbi:MAG TPA: RagB/SusD family nutrient uptake outer membrane protein, partial [Chryseolinea sp.]|nr:RagB/SusD family nutrient uptake outer membrane protein [Chryseolinea sp.]
DQKDITEIETEIVLPSNSYPEGKWRIYYEGINRANIAIRAFKGLSDPLSSKHQGRIAEARFLRGFYHYELWKIFHNIPYINDTIPDVRVGNTKNIVIEIQKDFAFAVEHLPPSQPDEPGRITKGAAKSYVGITWMWEKQWSKAKALFDDVINSGEYKLHQKYHDNFNPEMRNTPGSILDHESILAVQLSVNDGAFGGNGNLGDALNFNYGSGPFGCCGFHQPSQNLVNAFKTDSNGLPMLNSYNDPGEDVTNDDGMLSTDEPFTPYPGNLDPRLDWTVGRRGIPYIDWGKHPGAQWIRDQHYGGPYSPMKNVIGKSQVDKYSDKSWANLNSNNIKLLRYADLLLYAAEAEVELGNLNKALEYVNLVRERAANPEGFVMNGAVKAANYNIKPYLDFPSQEYARKAVRFERRIELGMEGHRFFDLVRWGIAAKEKNDYFAVESKKRNHLVGAKFTENKNEYMPIPQRAIDLSSLNGIETLEQNPGY